MMEFIKINCKSFLPGTDPEDIAEYLFEEFLSNGSCGVYRFIRGGRGIRLIKVVKDVRDILKPLTKIIQNVEYDGDVYVISSQKIYAITSDHDIISYYLKSGKTSNVYYYSRNYKRFFKLRKDAIILP